MVKAILIKDDVSEQDLINLVLSHYRKAKQFQKKELEFMKNKKFKHGDVVIKKKQNNLDSIFGNEVNDIGVIVGCYELDGIPYDEVLGYSYDNNRNAANMYRVYYNSNSSYKGEYVEDIVLHEGEIPDHLKDVVVNGVYFLGFNK